jgi:putative ABC transport system permease protein
MNDLRTANRAMFWRILRRLLGANRGRLFVMLLALGAGAAVTAALLNLQVDAKRRLTTEFRRFGANVIITPRQTLQTPQPASYLEESIVSRIPRDSGAGKVFLDSLLFTIADVNTARSEHRTSVVLVGVAGDAFNEITPMKVVSHAFATHGAPCLVGRMAAAHIRIEPNSELQFQSQGRDAWCAVGDVVETGGPEDDQIFLALPRVQSLAALPGRVSIILLRVTGSPDTVNQYLRSLQALLPDVDVRPIRQFTEGEAKIYSRISGLLTATVGIVLLLTALCVMAAMTNVAMERKMDVGLMKAIGGATRRVIRLFLAEAALLGLLGGLVGAAVGIFLSIGLGKAVFGVAARPRLIVYPVAVALTVLVAILSAFPLRRLATLRPASVFRGEA